MKLKAVEVIPGPQRAGSGRKRGGGIYDQTLTKFSKGRMKNAQVEYPGEKTEKHASSVYTSFIARRKALGLKEDVDVKKRGTHIYLAKR